MLNASRSTIVASKRMLSHRVLRAAADLQFERNARHAGCGISRCRITCAIVASYCDRDHACGYADAPSSWLPLPA